MSPLIKKVSARLIAARTAAGYKSARAFAIAFNIPYSTYVQYETAQRTLSLDSLVQYCDRLEIQPNWLLTGEGQPYQEQKNTAENKLALALAIRELRFDEILWFDNQTISRSSSVVNMELFCSILLETLQIYLTKKIPLTAEEMLEFCFDVYNSIVCASIDAKAKQTITKLAVNSLFRGKTITSTI